MHSKDEIGHFMKPKHNDHEEPLPSPSSRRDFLKASALAGLGTLAANAEAQAQVAAPGQGVVKLPSGITLGADIGDRKSVV